MTQVLRELTAGATCWSTDALRHVTVALSEINKLRERDAAHLVRRDGATDADVEAFNEWLANHADAGKVKVQPVENQGNGLVANADLGRGDAFISIPYDMILSADASLGPAEDRAPWNAVSNDPLLASFPSCLLALRVLTEACQIKKPSFFKPYIAMLPSTFDIPLYYDASDFAALDGSSLFDAAVKLLYNSIKQFFYLQRLCQQGWPRCPIRADAFTLSNYFWALGVVLTRQNEVVVGDSGRSAMALIPGWDMCNHEAGERITTFSDPVKRVVVCHAKRAFAARDQVAMFYGPRTNEELLIYSGFVAESNAWDRATIELRLDPSADPLVKIRRMVLQKEAAMDRSVELGDDTVHIQVAADGSLVSYGTLRVLQVLVLTKDSLGKALRSAGSLAADEIFEWTADERQAAREMFVRTCNDTERKFQSCLEKVAAAPRSALFQKYFEAQCSAVASAKQNTVVFDA